MKTRSTQPHVDPVPNSPDRAHRQRNKERRQQEAVMAGHIENVDVEILARRLREMEQRLARQAAPEQEVAPLNQLYRAPTDRYLGAGWGGGIAANNFELRPAFINMVAAEQFSGRATENPNAHLDAFLDICDTIKMNGVSDDIIRMRMFVFSLRDRAKEWFKSLDNQSITTWDQMCQAFLAKYFPPLKAQRIIAEITHFSQMGDESIYEAWERYKDLLRSCPQHGFTADQQSIHFYSGLTNNTKRLMDASAGGCLVNRTAAEALRIIEEMAATSYQWPMERQQTKPAAAVSDSDYAMDELRAEIEKLKMQVLEERRAHIDVNAVQQQGFQSNSMVYHPNNRNHPNFSYANPNNALQL